MKVKVIAKLNKRLWPSTRNAALPNPLIPNDILEVVEEVQGEAPPSSDNTKWYKTNEGFYVWSEGVENISKENLILKVTGNTFDVGKLAGTYWQNHFASLALRDDIFRSIGRFEIEGRPEFVATGFCINDQYLLTCRHVAREFATGPGNSDRWTIRKNVRCKIDFLADGIGHTKCVVGKNVRIDRVSDLALVEFTPASDQQQLSPLELAPAGIDVTSDDPLVVIGYPAENFDRTKKLSTALVAKKYKKSVAYDTIVRKGSSGSPVLNASLQLVGVHTATETIDGSLTSWASHHETIRKFVSTI